MILSVAPIGEYDKRVVILTKEKGKISAFAKGARRPNSPLAGACTPCNFGKFMLYEGRNSNTLQSAEIENYFAELRTDVEAAYYAFYFLEFADFYTREANDEREMLKLLYQTMRVLTKKIIPFELVRYIFELKALSVSGEGPQVFQCVRCGNRERPGKYRQYTTAFRKGPSLKLPPQTVSRLQSLSKGGFRLLSVCETPDLPHRPLTPEASLSI